MAALFSEIKRVATFTTRERRECETDGIDYNFVSDTQFSNLSNSGAIYETTRTYSDHLYGSPKELLENGGKHLMVELDYKGMFRLKQASCRKVVSIFLVPDLRELRNRIVHRGLEANLKARLDVALPQMQFAWAYDYVIQNIDLESMLASIAIVIKAELLRFRGVSHLQSHNAEYDPTFI
jgi:guanylate kinase